MKRIYIASPYTKGNTNENVRRQIDTAEELYAEGFLPIVPLLTHFWDFYKPHPYQWWLDLDFKYLEMCDGVLRLSGDSSGADVEVKHALKSGIPVFFDINSIVEYFNENEEAEKRCSCAGSKEGDCQAGK